MKKNIKLALKVIFIISLLALVSFGIYLLIIHIDEEQENFTNSNSNNEGLPTNDIVINTETEDSVMAQTPESAFKFKNYYLEKPPTYSSQTKVEFSNNLPEGVLVGDLNLSTAGKLNIAKVDGAGSQTNEYTISAHNQESNDRSLRLSMQDENNTNKSFEIWGASCRAQNDCKQSGVKLHKISDGPSYEIYGYNGNLIHKLGPNGIANHGGLNVNSGKHILFPSGHQYSDKSINSHDVNVRNRLYFSRTPANQDPDTSDFWTSHNSDKMYIEKVIDSNNRSKLIIQLGDDDNDPLEIHGKGNKIMEISNEKVKINVPLELANGQRFA